MMKKTSKALRKKRTTFFIFIIILNTVLFPFSYKNVYAFQVDPLPVDNLVVNPWFRDVADLNKAGFSGWTNVNNYWTLSQKISNPAPELISSGVCSSTRPLTPTYCGTSAKISGDDGNGLVGVDSYLYQIVAADPNNTKLKFFTHWVAHYVDPFKINIYGADTLDPNNLWTLVWTPINQQVLSLYESIAEDPISLWSYFTSLTPPVETVISQGYPYYKLEILVNLPKPDGFKITGVYFTVAPEIDPAPTSTPEVTGTPISNPTEMPTPTPTITTTSTPRETPDPTPSPTPALNNNPLIVTSKLNSGTLDRSYSSAVKGSDEDELDQLSMDGVNLPPGLSLGSCSTVVGTGLKKITCYLSGTPTSKGTYIATINLADDKGGIASKDFTIVIK